MASATSVRLLSTRLASYFDEKTKQKTTFAIVRMMKLVAAQMHVILTASRRDKVNYTSAKHCKISDF